MAEGVTNTHTLTLTDVEYEAVHEALVYFIADAADPAERQGRGRARIAALRVLQQMRPNRG